MKRTMTTLMVVLAALALATAAYAADTDGDGVDDAADNCVAAANTDQFDGDGDGVGNACDADFDNDGAITALDFEILQAAFLAGSDDADFDPALDLDGDGLISGTDITIYLQLSSS